MNSDPLRVVIIEDELAIRRFLRAGLGEEAELHEAEGGEAGIKLVARQNPDVVLLDLGLPDLDGLEVLSRLREWTEVPVIVLSARGQERDKVTALDRGADDYLTKPFTIGELMARIRVVLRRSRRADAPADPIFESGALKIDFGARLAFMDGRELHLTLIEYKLLSLLARHAGKVLTHNQIINEVWGPAYLDSTHTLRVHMGNLRGKIEVNPGRPQYIRTETGVGYRMPLLEG